MGAIAVPTSQQHMMAGFMLVTMEEVVLASTYQFFFVDPADSCLDLFQSMLMKIMFASAVLCSTGTLPRSVTAAHAELLLVPVMLPCA